MCHPEQREGSVYINEICCAIAQILRYAQNDTYILHLKHQLMENKNVIWSKLLKIVITVLTAVATTFGLQACC